jgi:hypothetical protein
MDIVEKKLIEFIHESDENMNVTYSNQLAGELLTIIKMQHKRNHFKGKTYSNTQQLHYDMAKYYVKAFQVYYAIKKIKKLQIVPELEEVKHHDFPSLVEPLSDLHIAYNYAYHLKQIHESYTTLDKIESNLMKDTFLPSLEEMDEIVLETKKNIRQIIYPKNLLDTIELFSEKKQFTELKKLFSNL